MPWEEPIFDVPLCPHFRCHLWFFPGLVERWFLCVWSCCLAFLASGKCFQIDLLVWEIFPSHVFVHSFSFHLISGCFLPFWGQNVVLVRFWQMIAVVKVCFIVWLWCLFRSFLQNVPLVWFWQMIALIPVCFIVWLCCHFKSKGHTMSADKNKQSDWSVWIELLWTHLCSCFPWRLPWSEFVTGNVAQVPLKNSVRTSVSRPQCHTNTTTPISMPAIQHNATAPVILWPQMSSSLIIWK